MSHSHVIGVKDSLRATYLAFHENFGRKAHLAALPEAL